MDALTINAGEWGGGFNALPLTVSFGSERVSKNEDRIRD